MTLDEFRALPTIQSQFPLVFRDGARWERIEGSCGSCDQTFEELRGQVTHPFASVFIVDGWGLCPACARLTSFRYRFHEDMGMTGIHAPTGEWARWEPIREGFIRRWFRRMFGKKKI